MKHLLIAAASLGLAFALPTSTLAQETAASQPAQPTAYADLVAAMQDGIDQEMVIDNQLAVVRSLWQADPNMVAAEAAYPGLFDAMIDAGRPIITRHSQEIQDEYRPRYVAALAEALTEQEAARIAEFYRSPLGAKMLGGLSRTMDGRAMIEGGIANGEIDMRDFDTDIRKSAGQIVGALSAQEQADLVRLFTTDPALMKMNDLQAIVLPIRAEMEKAAMAPARQKEIEAAIKTAAERHIAGG